MGTGFSTMARRLKGYGPRSAVSFGALHVIALRHRHEVARHFRLQSIAIRAFDDRIPDVAQQDLVPVDDVDVRTVKGPLEADLHRPLGTQGEPIGSPGIRHDAPA